jgi:hypothetical protein
MKAKHVYVGVIGIGTVGALTALAAPAQALQGVLLEMTYPGAQCNAAVQGNKPVLNWLEMLNNSSGSEWALCPFPNDANSQGPAVVNNARIAFTGSNSSALNCSLSINEGADNGWNIGWVNTNAFSGYWELQWPNYVLGQYQRWNGTAFNCSLQPGAAVTNYGIVSWFGVQDSY